MKIKDFIHTKAFRVMHWINVALMLTAIITLSCFVGIYASDRKKFGNDIENIYSMAYYELLESNLRLENNLSKIGVITSPSLVNTALVEITKDASTASCAIGTMGTSGNNLRTIIAFYNQLGDYHSYLQRSLKDTGKLGEKDLVNVKTFAQRARKIGGALTEMQSKISEGYKFAKLLGKDGDAFGTIIKDFDTDSQGKYPSLIYDGPFSDGVNDRPAKGIVGEDITEAKALELVDKYLVGYKIMSKKITGTSLNRIPSYVIDAEVSGERNASLVIAKKGGMLLSMNVYKKVVDPRLSAEDAEVLAEQYCTKIGLNSMKAVWISINDSIAYINLCFAEGGVIMYPDMVKVKVSLDSGEVIGFEGLNYAFSHTVRELDTPTLSEEDAILLVNSGLLDLNARLVLIPLTLEKEVLCYEISGKIGEEMYFIYLDVATREEIKILRVIDSNQGELLM